MCVFLVNCSVNPREDIVVSVNDKTITEHDINQVKAFSRLVIPDHSDFFQDEYFKQQFRQDALDFLIDTHLIEEKIKKQNIEISKEEIWQSQQKQTTEMIEVLFENDSQEFEKAKSKAGISDAAFKNILKRNYLLFYFKEYLTSNITVDDIRNYYQRQKGTLDHPSTAIIDYIRLKTKEEASETIRQILSGKQFEKVREEFSLDSNSQLTIHRTDPALGENFNKAVFELKENEISLPIKTENGWYIVRAYEIDEGFCLESENMKRIVVNDYFNSYTDLLRNKATIKFH